MPTLATTKYPDASPQWLDRQWFDEQPARRLRLRKPMPIELSHYGICTHIIVIKISKGERMRMAARLYAVPADILELLCGDSSNSVHIDEMLVQLARAIRSGRTMDFQQLVRSVDRHFAAALAPAQ